MVRVWRPGAVAVRVRQQPEGKLLGEMSESLSGLFELHLPRRRKHFSYELELTCEDGSLLHYYDPYQFGQYVLKQSDIEPVALYRHLGSSLFTHRLNSRKLVQGVLFKVYAPNARSVSVVGDFNGWDGRLHPMASADDGIWRLFVPGVSNGDLYKFEIHDHHGNRLPLKSDPFGRYAEQWPGLASIVHEQNDFTWSDEHWLASRSQSAESVKNRPMSVYEVHPGSWKKHEDGRPLSYRELAEELVPYVKKMGFTHIELMPVSEHPLYESWGYQPVGLFAATSRYGSPEDFKYLVNCCHNEGLAVILDWVPAHFPSDDHGLARFDGSALFEYEDPDKGWHPDWKTHIYNFGSRWVQDFLISNALYWLDEFHIDGLRVDAVASMLYLDYSREPGQWQPNIHGGNEHLEAVEFLHRLNESVHAYFPDCLTIAEESTSWPGVSRAVGEGGLGFDFKWNMGWMHDSLEYMKRAPEYRKHHHNELSFSMVYAYNENFVLPLSHDEVVHGKGSLLNRMPGDDWQKFANLRACYGFMFTHPGKKLLFMGSELASHAEWDVSGSLPWELLAQGDRHKGVQSLVRDLNVIYRTTPAMHELDQDHRGFRWLVLEDHEQSVFAFTRFDQAGTPLVVISNMTPVVRHDYRIGVPSARAGLDGTNDIWHELLNTDDVQYGGSGVGNEPLHVDAIPSHEQQGSLTMTLPPLATVILKPVTQCNRLQ